MNLDIYTTEMSKSVWDKAFFMDKIPGVKYVVDFGCADGAMIHYLAPLFPDIKFIGYDINSELITRAKSKTPFYANTIFFDDIAQVIGYLYAAPIAESNEICINFSSVLHEVFSSTGGLDVITNFINEIKPRYITIRDMYYHWGYENSDKTIVLDVYNAIKTNVISEDAILSFEKHSGDLLLGCKKLSHFLMKYQWIDNGWEDELKEDYYAFDIKKFLKLIQNKYDIIFETHYQLSYLLEMWKKKYNIYLPKLHTHAQFILRRDD